MTTAAIDRSWNAEASRFVLLNAILGIAVLASYAWGLALLGGNADAAWGGVPAGLRPVYQLSMVLAAVGYFPMTLWVLDGLRTSRPATQAAPALYAVILGCSAVWLPLTCAMLARPSAPLWWAIRIDLALVGLASVAVLAMIARDRSRTPTAWWKAAVAGAAAFSVQTALLDAIVWPAYFPAWT